MRRLVDFFVLSCLVYSTRYLILLAPYFLRHERKHGEESPTRTRIYNAVSLAQPGRRQYLIPPNVSEGVYSVHILSIAAMDCIKAILRHLSSS